MECLNQILVMVQNLDRHHMAGQVDLSHHLDKEDKDLVCHNHMTMDLGLVVYSSLTLPQVKDNIQVKILVHLVVHRYLKNPNIWEENMTLDNLDCLGKVNLDSQVRVNFHNNKDNSSRRSNHKYGTGSKEILQEKIQDGTMITSLTDLIGLRLHKKVRKVKAVSKVSQQAKDKVKVRHLKDLVNRSKLDQEIVKVKQ